MIRNQSFGPTEILESGDCFSLSRGCLVKSLYGRLLSLCLVLIYSIRIGTVIIIKSNRENSRTLETVVRRSSYLFYAASFHYRLRLITFDIFDHAYHSSRNYSIVYTVTIDIKMYLFCEMHVLIRIFVETREFFSRL